MTGVTNTLATQVRTQLQCAGVERHRIGARLGNPARKVLIEGRQVERIDADAVRAQTRRQRRTRSGRQLVVPKMPGHMMMSQVLRPKVCKVRMAESADSFHIQLLSFPKPTEGAV